jgi:UDP-N-acetylmuramoyl-L-alanyl-D-glutamate--2,6-diaminopimelate ligase
MIGGFYLKDIFPHLNLTKEMKMLEVRGISEDSRLVRKGDIFFVKERKNFDIFSVLKSIEKNVTAFVVEFKNRDRLKTVISKKPIIAVGDIRKEFFRVVDKFYGFNKDRFKFIGVTGTNGKTTTTHLLYYLLKKMGEKVSLIGTVNYFIGDKVYRANHTTPDYLTLRKILQKIRGKSPQFVVMEVSSHSIDQERIKGVEFLRCVFTNLSRDHLDYHKTMQNYFDTKKKLFACSKECFSIINVDDIYGRRLLRKIRCAFSYGISRKADFCAQRIRWSKGGGEFNLSYKDENIAVRTQLYGRHNVLNILAAIATVFSLGFSLKEIVKLLPSFERVEGRLEEVLSDIFVDYAHTPEALKQVLLTLKEIGYEKIICVFGCGGDRDRGKRRRMGKVAYRYAYFTFITSDNPRSEDPFRICCDIERGFRDNSYMVVLDRKTAIGKAIKLKNKYKNSCVLIAGKGHEDYQIVGNEKIPFKDSSVVKELLRHKKKYDYF